MPPPGPGRPRSPTAATAPCRARIRSPAAAPSAQVTASSSPTPRAAATPSRWSRAGSIHTHRGGLAHDDLIGEPEGSVVVSRRGTPYLALRPLLADYVLSMPRGAQVIYPKDAAQIVACGATSSPAPACWRPAPGSGALTCSLLRAVGPAGAASSPTRSAPTMPNARRNVETLLRRDAAELESSRSRDLNATTASQSPSIGSCSTCSRRGSASDTVAAALVPGGVLVGYVATTTQLSRLVEALREQRCWTEPQAWESLVRPWHVVGLAVRPEHRMIGHTAFLVTARRLADGVGSAPTTAPSDWSLTPFGAVRLVGSVTREERRRRVKCRRLSDGSPVRRSMPNPVRRYRMETEHGGRMP